MTKENANAKGGLRFDAGKIKAYLIPAEAMIEFARIFSKGAAKYADHNWRKGMPWSKVIGPLDRHLIKFKMGEVVDQETQCYHIAMVAWNAFALFVYQLQKLGFDDRILPETHTIDDNMNWIELKPAQKAANAKHNAKVYAYIAEEEAKKKSSAPKEKKSSAPKEKKSKKAKVETPEADPFSELSDLSKPAEFPKPSKMAVVGDEITHEASTNWGE